MVCLYVGYSLFFILPLFSYHSFVILFVISWFLFCWVHCLFTHKCLLHEVCLTQCFVSGLLWFHTISKVAFVFVPLRNAFSLIRFIFHSNTAQIICRTFRDKINQSFNSWLSWRTLWSSSWFIILTCGSPSVDTVLLALFPILSLRTDAGVPFSTDAGDGDTFFSISMDAIELRFHVGYCKTIQNIFQSLENSKILVYLLIRNGKLVPFVFNLYRPSSCLAHLFNKLPHCVGANIS